MPTYKSNFIGRGILKSAEITRTDVSWIYKVVSPVADVLHSTNEHEKIDWSPLHIRFNVCINIQRTSEFTMHFPNQFLLTVPYFHAFCHINYVQSVRITYIAI
jgi:hypothetical protein